ncbi:hypothetical protein F2P81_000156 [Scophthalmus maximus]|uniref:Uncharacterized protein n=1 Tax=Scophthalmus maximus TaxID=52904 RepID=A0A6A4TKD8_SCOMX|nr:hypothetical protein F2P81_000156 [Scophthalmus maximus]
MMWSRSTKRRKRCDLKDIKCLVFFNQSYTQSRFGPKYWTNGDFDRCSEKIPKLLQCTMMRTLYNIELRAALSDTSAIRANDVAHVVADSLFSASELNCRADKVGDSEVQLRETAAD